MDKGGGLIAHDGISAACTGVFVFLPGGYIGIDFCGSTCGARVAVTVTNGRHGIGIPIRAFEGCIASGAEANSIRDALRDFKASVTKGNKEGGSHWGRDKEVLAGIFAALRAKAVFAFGREACIAEIKTAAFLSMEGNGTGFEEGIHGCTHLTITGLHVGGRLHTNGDHTSDGLEISRFGARDINATLVISTIVLGAAWATSTGASAEIGGATGSAKGGIIEFIHITVELLNDSVDVEVFVKKEFLANRGSVDGPKTYVTPGIRRLGSRNGVKPADHGVMGGVASFFTPEPMPRASADHDHIHEMLEAKGLVHEGVTTAVEIKLGANVAEGVLHGCKGKGYSNAVVLLLPSHRAINGFQFFPKMERGTPLRARCIGVIHARIPPPPHSIFIRN